MKRVFILILIFNANYILAQEIGSAYSKELDEHVNIVHNLLTDELMLYSIDKSCSDTIINTVVGSEFLTTFLQKWEVYSDEIFWEPELKKGFLFTEILTPYTSRNTVSDTVNPKLLEVYRENKSLLLQEVSLIAQNDYILGKRLNAFSSEKIWESIDTCENYFVNNIMVYVLRNYPDSYISQALEK